MRTILLMLLLSLPANAQYVGTYHVIPQVADGFTADTTYYSRIIITAHDSNIESCTLEFRGGLTGVYPRQTLNMRGFSAYTHTTDGRRPLLTGYATVACNVPVSVNTFYVLTDARGVRSLATVFSAGAFRSASIAAYRTPTTRIALALANNSTSVVNYTITVNIGGNIIGRNLTIGPGVANARFIDEDLALPAPSAQGDPIMVYIESNTYLVGTSFLYSGEAFTTVPLGIYY